jgi:hypothetical protein
MRWCDSRGIGCGFGLAKNPVLKRSAIEEISRAQRQFLQIGQLQRIFGWFAYSALTWDRQRRVFVKGEHNADGADPGSS